MYLIDLESLTVDCINPRKNLVQYNGIKGFLKTANEIGSPIHVISSRDISSIEARKNILRYAKKVTAVILDDIIPKDIKAARNPDNTENIMKKRINENKKYYPIDNVDPRESIESISQKVSENKTNEKPNAYAQLLGDITRAEKNINNIKLIQAIYLKAGLDKDIYNLLVEEWPKKITNGRFEKRFWMENEFPEITRDELILQIMDHLGEDEVYYYGMDEKGKCTYKWTIIRDQFLEANVWVNNYVHQDEAPQRIPNVYFKRGYWTDLIRGKSLPKTFIDEWTEVYRKSHDYYHVHKENKGIIHDDEGKAYYSDKGIPIFAQAQFQDKKRTLMTRTKKYIDPVGSVEFGIFHPWPATSSFLDHKQGAVSSLIHLLVIPSCSENDELIQQRKNGLNDYSCSKWYNASSLSFQNNTDVVNTLKRMKKDGIKYGNKLFEYFKWDTLVPFKDGVNKNNPMAKTIDIENKVVDHSRTKLTNNRSENMEILQRDGIYGGWDLANVSANYIADAFAKNQTIKPKWYCGFHLSQSKDYTRRGFSVAYLHMHVINLNLLTKSGVFALQKTCPVSVIIDYLEDPQQHRQR
jgi:hypothetical protein